MAILDVIPFGINDAAIDLEATESISITHSSDKAEVVGQDGNIYSCSYYNPNGEWTATGYNASTPSATIGVALDMAKTGGQTGKPLRPGSTGASGGTGGAPGATAVIYTTEITLEEGPEDFVKYTVKGQYWGQIVA